MAIMKNLTMVRHGRDEATLRLKKEGPGAVTAGDIELDHDIEVRNPDFVIATLNERGSLNMTLTVRRGRGYQAVEARESDEDETRTVGSLKLDATFSPDRKSTRLNSSHVAISYAVFCLQKKTDRRPR